MYSNVISNPVIESEVMDAKEAAKYLKISYWLILKLARESQIPQFRCGNMVMFRKSTLDRFIAEQEKQSYRFSSERK